MNFVWEKLKGFQETLFVTTFNKYQGLILSSHACCNLFKIIYRVLVNIEGESILNENEKQYIETVILGEHISFFWAENQVENDSKPFLYHTLIHKKTQQIHSDYA